MTVKWWLAAALCLVAAAGVSCGGSEATAPKQTQITGSWNATKVEYVSTGGLGTVDLIAGGATATMVLGADNSFTYACTPAGGGTPTTTHGTYVLTRDVIQVTPTGSAWSWTWSVVLSNNSLRLTGASAEYDFNTDGVGEPATWNLTFTR
ncbi:MAG TPA: lipocalin family protein [Candidatus Saccharimonadales bacterium]|nr:lipocalin family protein [Candidatus Saccharimonadales bacterium]